MTQTEPLRKSLFVAATGRREADVERAVTATARILSRLGVARQHEASDLVRHRGLGDVEVGAACEAHPPAPVSATATMSTTTKQTKTSLNRS